MRGKKDGTWSGWPVGNDSAMPLLPPSTVTPRLQKLIAGNTQIARKNYETFTAQLKPAKSGKTAGKRKHRHSMLEERAWALLSIYGILNADTKREHRFARDLVGDGPRLRQRLYDARLSDWRFDIAFVDRKVAIELEGGIWTGGRHTRGNGFSDDCRKYNAAQVNGWIVLRFTGDHLKNEQEFIQTVRSALEGMK